MEKILIAMSGGVDSSVAAEMIKNEYGNCLGATMKLFNDNSADIKDAELICKSIGIPFFAFDLKKEFEENVIKDFIETYENGGTPNPCVVCNRHLKFGKLLEIAKSLGCSSVATGHYARIDILDGRYCVRKAVDLSKDQSYVLYSLTQNQLAHSIFPLGNMSKADTIKLAEKQNFVTSHKKESQDICFVPDGDYAKFIEEYTKEKSKPGFFKDTNGNILGNHNGIIRYTIGQRKGLGIALNKPMYVLKKDIESNSVILCENEELFGTTVSVKDFNWLSDENPKKDFKAKAKIRYNMKEESCTVCPVGENEVKIVFDLPQRAITKGQSAVVYFDDYVIGGGIIE